MRIMEGASAAEIDWQCAAGFQNVTMTTSTCTACGGTGWVQLRV
jgi:hypothetical protein